MARKKRAEGDSEEQEVPKLFLQHFSAVCLVCVKSCAKSCMDSSVCFFYGYGFVSLGRYCSPHSIRYAPVFYKRFRRRHVCKSTFIPLG